LAFRIGCSGWSYADWVGPFYPKGTEPQDYLRLYSSIFDCVEIDSTFYGAPSATMVQQWYNSTPEGFLFAPKLPKRITHDRKLENVASYMEHFTNTLSLLNEKLGPFVIQLPPSFKMPKHGRVLADFLANLNANYRYAIEFRHESCFEAETEELLKAHNVCQVWSVNQYLSTPPNLTADFVYLRFVGDRAISEFSRIQKDQSETMGSWSKALRKVGDNVRDRFVFFNNHFAGFGPASVNEFRRLMGLVELDWSGLRESGGPQRTLFDYYGSS